MKYDSMFKAFGMVFSGVVKSGIKDKAVMKSIKSQYREIVERAKDIGSGNRLLGSYAMAAYFIAMNRCDGFDAEKNCDILENGLRNSKLYKAFMGNANSYFSDKNMQSRREWSKQTYERKYENDWVVDVIEKTPEYEFGFDYHECGVCKLCKDEGCFEFAQYLCRLDYMTTDIMGIKLKRTMTLAQGYDKCDFRFSK